MGAVLLSTPRLKPEPGARAPGFFKQMLAESARDWSLSPSAIILLMVAPLLVALGGMLAAALGDQVYRWLTGEDRFAENLQVLLWLITFGMGLVVMSRLGQTGRHGMAFLYLCLNVGIFFIIGEEVSWGQRLFGWSTPAALKAINRQHETNIHNLDGMVSAFRWLYLLIGAYGTLPPLLLWRLPCCARYREIISTLVPHYALSPYFFAMFAWRIYLNFWKLPVAHYFVLWKYSEVIELILAIGFFLFMSFQLRKNRPHG